jgi:hypothetical protein
MQRRMQQRKFRPCLLAGAAMSVVSVISSHAAITGFSGFAPVNTTGGSSIGYSPDGSTFELTDGGGSEATAGFASTPQVISSFVASFTYTVPGGPSSTSQYSQADGFTFIIQDDPRGTSAVGGTGGDKGYRGTSTGSTAIANSVALGYEMYSGTTFDYSTNAASYTTSSVGFQIANGDPVQVTVAYNGTALQTGVYDPATKKSFVATDPNINLAAILGSSTAYIGFGGGTGSAASTQKISNFTFTPSAYTYNPITLASGYNQDMVIEAGAPASGAINNITATMDAGTAKTGATYYEQGYNTGAPLTGLPASGGTFTSQADSRHIFTMGNYSSNNAALLSPTATTDTITFANPSAFYALSFLTATGNGTAAFDLTINYADGAPSTYIPYDVVSPDWFFQGPAAFIANGRAYPGTGATTYDNVNNGEPNLYQLDVLMPDTTDPISSVTLNYDATAGNLAVFAVSGAAVPEPTTLGLLAASTLALLGRRRRRA